MVSAEERARVQAEAATGQAAAEEARFDLARKLTEVSNAQDIISFVTEAILVTVHSKFGLFLRSHIHLSVEQERIRLLISCKAV